MILVLIPFFAFLCFSGFGFTNLNPPTNEFHMMFNMFVNMFLRVEGFGYMWLSF